MPDGSTPPVDSGAADAAPDAGDPLDQLAAEYLDALLKEGARCNSNWDPPPVQPELLALIRQQLTAEGTTDAWRDALRACIASLDDGLCDGKSQACLDSESPLGTLPNGSLCRLDAQCGSGLCGLGATDAVCGVCTAAVAPGGDCSGERLRSCGPHTECAPDSICRPTAIAAEGSTCDGTILICPRGTACVNNGVSSTCMRAAGAGGICKTDALQVPCANSGSQACDDTTKVCAPLPTVGQACPDRSCAAGSICDPVDLHCRHRKVDVPVGTRTEGSDSCVAGASPYFDGNVGYATCAVEIPLGGTCGGVIHANCQAGLACSAANVCTDVPDCP